MVMKDYSFPKFSWVIVPWGWKCCLTLAARQRNISFASELSLEKKTTFLFSPKVKCFSSSVCMNALGKLPFWQCKRALCCPGEPVICVLLFQHLLLCWMSVRTLLRPWDVAPVGLTDHCTAKESLSLHLSHWKSRSLRNNCIVNSLEGFSSTAGAVCSVLKIAATWKHSGVSSSWCTCGWEQNVVMINGFLTWRLTVFRIWL